MRTWIRVTVTSALALTCLDGHAKVADKCIQTLEAHPTRPDATTRPCPLAIGYAPRVQASSGRPRRAIDAALPRRAVTTDAAEARVEGTDAAAALHA